MRDEFTRPPAPLDLPKIRAWTRRQREVQAEYRIHPFAACAGRMCACKNERKARP